MHLYGFREADCFADQSFDARGSHLRRDSFMTSMPEYNDAFPLPGLR
jgi:hypothetical protein